uniref:EGF-like domain-containing protein n=1 Tax=Romanomermis culicivorax TaxID=13658 RepID=A0A915K7K0_ROMCU
MISVNTEKQTMIGRQSQTGAEVRRAPNMYIKFNIYTAHSAGENFHGLMRNMQMNDVPLIKDQILNDVPIYDRPVEKLHDFMNDDNEGAIESSSQTFYDTEEEPSSYEDYTSAVIVSNTTKIPSSNICNEGYCQQGVCRMDDFSGKPGCECFRGFSGKRCQFCKFQRWKEIKIY